MVQKFQVLVYLLLRRSVFFKLVRSIFKFKDFVFFFRYLFYCVCGAGDKLGIGKRGGNCYCIVGSFVFLKFRRREVRLLLFILQMRNRRYKEVKRFVDERGSWCFILGFFAFFIMWSSSGVGLGFRQGGYGFRACAFFFVGVSGSVWVQFSEEFGGFLFVC